MDKREQGFEEEIRRKLSEAPMDFDEAAWDKMEQKLSGAASPGRRRIIPLWWLRGAAAAIILSLGIWAYTGLFRGEGSDGTQPAEGYAGREAPGEGAGGDQPGEEKPAVSGDEGPVSAREEGPAAGRRPASGQDIASGQNLAGGQGNALNRKSTSPDGNNGQETGQVKSGLAIAAITGLEGRFAETAEELEKGVVSVEVPSIAGPLIDLPPDGSLTAVQPGNAIGSENTAKGASGREGAADGGEIMPEPDPLGQGISFSLGVLAAPDLNAVKGFNGGKLGFNTGLSFGVHFNDRLSLHTGIVYSKKPYDALPSDYHTGRDLPESLVNIAARCDVIDIPLNLRYTFYRKGRNSIALSAGLSSYLMLREKYSYNYEGYDPRVYEYKNENRHFMGVGNAGIVFGRKLNDHLSIGLQPFIKAPLTGIGHGNVKLISTGAALQLNLNLNKK